MAPQSVTCAWCHWKFMAPPGDSYAVQCEKCLKSFCKPVPDAPESLQKCDKCGRRWETLINGKCLVCSSPSIVFNPLEFDT